MNKNARCKVSMSIECNCIGCVHVTSHYSEESLVLTLRWKTIGGCQCAVFVYGEYPYETESSLNFFFSFFDFQHK